MEHIRRCTLVFILAFLAACGTIQAPQAQQLNPEIPMKGQTVPPDAEPPKTNVQLQKSDTILASSISRTFGCPLDVAVKAIKSANMYAYKDFPKKTDILAMIAIESRFDPLASYKGSKGLMQVLYKTHRHKIQGEFNVQEQVRIGVSILRSAYEATRSHQGAVMAYNVGEGAYKRGARPTAYFSKFKKSLDWFKNQERNGFLV